MSALLSIQSIADMLGMRLVPARRLVMRHRDRIKVYRIGGRVRVDALSFEQFIKEHRL